MNTVRFGDKDVIEYGCYLAHYEISAPSVQTKYIKIPLRNGALDLTELLTDEPKYDNRKITVQLLYLGDYIENTASNIENYLHGQRFNIEFDDEASYFYAGRCSVKGYSKRKKGGGGTITIEVDADPFKYSVVSSDDDWLWDPFDFEEGYINELKNIVVSGSRTVSLIADAKPTYATITTNAQMNVTYKNKTVTVAIGSTVLYDFEFAQGENTIVLTGNGTVTISYRGGRL